MPDLADFEAILMRHGQTEWSISGRHTGNTDIPLTAGGVAEAEAMAEHVKQREYAAVLSSPLQRALETCRVIGLGDQVQIREELREWDYGDYEGLTTPEIRAQDPNWVLWRDGCPGGESPAQVTRRCDVIVAELAVLAESGKGDAVVFAHGHILRALAARWCELPTAYGAHFRLSTAAVSAIGFEHAVRAIKFWNHAPGDE